MYMYNINTPQTKIKNNKKTKIKKGKSFFFINIINIIKYYKYYII